MKTPKQTAICNHCHKQMDGMVELEKTTIPVCTNPACPNFSLLQISAEKMAEFIIENNKQK